MDMKPAHHHRSWAFSLFLNFSLLFLISLFTISTSNNNDDDPSSIPIHLNHHHHRRLAATNCGRLRKLVDHKSKCAYVKSNTACWGQGYFNYLQIFYCNCTNRPILGYSLLLLWLLLLFYVLGNTTSDYFCPSVQGLSRALKLSPTIAGTTLLPLGNGANDVFSSIISFTHSGDADVGLNSILGGALFITCFVVGVVSIAVSSRRVRVHKASFARDVLCFLFVLCCLLLIMVFGRINLWFALCFISLYFLYIALVSIMHLSRHDKGDNAAIGSMVIPLLGYVDDQEKGTNSSQQDCHKPLNLFLYVLELPISLPRKLTIPSVSEENWSKPFATISATLAPILLAALCNLNSSFAIYLTAISTGLIMGTLALVFTKSSSPPKRFLLPWLAGGFLMSIVWTYIVVEELVSLVVAFGNIIGISPSILGLTVLAWGNSLGDLVSNLAVALRGGADGAQVALSGCYAGPLFNTLVGLGLSMVLAAWKDYPRSYPVPGDGDMYETVGFLMGGLLWALVILPNRNMQLDKALGLGLLAIYLCFLFLRLVKSIGLLNLGE